MVSKHEFSQKRMFLVLFCSRRTAYIVRDNVKKFISYKDVILFSKIFYMFDVIYVDQIEFYANFPIRTAFQSAAWVRFPMGSENLIYLYTGTGCVPFVCVMCFLSLVVALAFC